MKVGIAGFSGSGKTTMFQWLTGVAPDPSKMQTGQMGVAKVPDERLDWLSAHFKPKKTTPATLELLDTPGLLRTERKDNARRLGIMRDAGTLLVVLNGFNDGDPAEELLSFREEILFADLEIVTGSIRRLEDKLKKPKKGKERELEEAQLALMRRIGATLEDGESAAAVGLTDDEEKKVRSFQLLTLKQELVILNINEDGLAKDLPAKLLELSPQAQRAASLFEMELAELPEDEREMFMPEDGAVGPTREEVLRTIFYGSGQIVFFTVGHDECRAWGVPKGATAEAGAGAIHTDLQRGFVRGEVVTFEDFQRVGSMKEAKTQGVYRLEGKTHALADGDIMHVLAST